LAHEDGAMPAVRLFLAAVVAALAWAPAAVAAPGDPDPSFSQDGGATYTFGFGGAVAALPQGERTVLVGSAMEGDDGRVALARVTAAGDPDPTFGPDGRILLSAASGSGAADAVQLPDGDIVVLSEDPPGAVDGVALTRLNPDGSPHTSFGTGGVAVISADVFGAPERDRNWLSAIALRAQGETLVVGVNYVSANDDLASWSYLRRVGAIRVDVDSGAPDPTFGEAGGAVATAPSGYATWGNLQDLAVEPISGKVLLVEAVSDNATLGDRTVVYRLDSDGVLDDSFGTDGAQVVRFLPDETSPELSEWPSALQPLADGGVAIAGSVSTELYPRRYRGVVARLDATGELDPAFGGDGIVDVAPTGIAERGFDALALIDGQLYAGGHEVRFDVDSNRQPARGWIARFDDAGLDETFGQGGTSLVGEFDGVSEIFAAGDGLVAIAGVLGFAEHARWSMARAFTGGAAAPQPTPTPPTGGGGGGGGGSVGGGGGGGGGATGPAPAPATTPTPATPTAPSTTPPVVTVDTRTTATMPEVRGLKIDEARARIQQAGIHALIDSEEKVRAKPLELPGKGRLGIGDVSAQSLSAGTPVVSSVGEPKRIRLITEAGPKATAANGGALGAVCTGKPFRDELRGVSLADVEALLKAKGCRRVDRDFVVSKQATSLEVRRATKGDDALELMIVVPGDPANLDLTPVFRQGAFNGNPSFGRDDWALTAGVMNIFGVQAITRANATVKNVEVFVDGSNVGADDIRARADGPVFVRGFAPTKAGLVNVLLAQQDALGNTVYGFGRFRVVQRSGSFVAIDGKRYTVGRGPAVARAAGFADILAELGRLAQGLGDSIAALFSGTVTEGTLTAATTQNVGLTQLSLGDVLNGSAQVVSAGGANVVSAGGGNVVAVGGGNVVSVGGGNAIALARGGVISAGGGNLIGKDTIDNGTGRLMKLSAGVVAGGGGNVISAGGANVVSGGGANVIAVGGGN